MRNSYKVGAMTYTVREEFQLEDGDFGKTLMGNCEIVINSQLSEQRKKQTITHELVHALLMEAGLVQQCGEEALVEPLSNILHQFLQDNFENKA